MVSRRHDSKDIASDRISFLGFHVSAGEKKRIQFCDVCQEQRNSRHFPPYGVEKLLTRVHHFSDLWIECLSERIV